MVGYCVFVLVVDFYFEEFRDAIRRPHFDCIPCHPFADVNAYLAADTFIEPDLHIRHDDVDAAGGIARSKFNTSTGQKLTQASQPVQLSGMTTAISFGFFFFRVIFAGASGMIRVGFALFGSYATF